jgi:hypothetical protein
MQSNAAARIAMQQHATGGCSLTPIAKPKLPVCDVRQAQACISQGANIEDCHHRNTGTCIGSSELRTARPSQPVSSAGDAGTFIGGPCSTFFRRSLHSSLFSTHVARRACCRSSQSSSTGSRGVSRPVSSTLKTHSECILSIILDTKTPKRLF